MKNDMITEIIKEWKAEAGVKTPVMYKTFCPRDSKIKWLYITTDRPQRMEEHLLHYYPLLIKTGLFGENLSIRIDKSDYCVY